MRKYILLVMLAFGSTFAYAYNFQVDGVFYNIVDKNNCIVEVTYGDAEYSGSVTIPATVKKDGVTYTVASVGISAFSSCGGLTEVKIGDGVELIYHSAFSYCTSLKSVTLGSHVRKIGNRAFSHCSSLSKINLNDQIVMLGEDAFEQCTSLTSVVIGSKVEEMGSGVFQLCTNLKTVEIHDGASVISSSAFNRCEKLTSVTIPNSVSQIGISAFSGCSSLTEVKIGDGVELIYHSAFSYCTSLESVTLGSHVRKIGNYAFSNCSSLSKINLNDQIVKFGENAFEQCTSLTSVVIGSKVEEMGSGVFLLCTNLETVEIHEGASVIGWSAFKSCEKLTSVTIPNSVLEIGGSAFSGCSSLTDVKIGEGVETISNSAFSYCTNLNKVSLGSSVKKVNSRSFEGCNKMTSFTVKNPNPPEVAGNDAFSDYSATLYVPSGSIGAYQKHEIWKKFYNIKEIGGSSDDIIVFADPEVKRICVENWDTNGDGELSKTEAAAVTELGRVFRENEKIKTFDELGYFTGLKEIGEWTFVNCDKLTSVTIPSSVTSIGEYAFGQCELTSLSIPNSVSFIASGRMGAFWNCHYLTSITVEEGNQVYDSRNNCNAIIETASNILILGCHNTEIPQSVTSIGESAFYNCLYLTSVIIPEDQIEIGDYTFRGCQGLTSIIIPNNVIIIGEGAFDMCDGLTSVFIGKSVTTICDYVFQDCYSLNTIVSYIQEPSNISTSVFSNYSWSLDKYLFTDATLYVPVGTKAKYEDTEGWKEFKTIIEGEPSAIQSPTVITSSDIYSITGRKVRSNATSLDGLPKGIYILNGKKVIK